MSYDLFFRTDRDSPSVEALRAWLSARPHTTLAGDLATYRHETTGVSFQFDLTDEARPGAAPITFTMPLPRPSVAALVAEAEVQALVAAFGLLVFDPQPGGLGFGEWSRDGFLRGWRIANAAAHRDLFRGPRANPVPTLPTRINTAVLAWNRSAEAYADRLAAVEWLPCTVPEVLLLSPPEDERVVLTAVHWDGEPAAIPDVDLVLASARSLLREARTCEPARCIPLVALRPWLRGFERRPADHRFGRMGRSHLSGLAHWVADTDPAPAGLIEALRSLGAVRELERVAPERVLDREAVAVARAGYRSWPGAVPSL